MKPPKQRSSAISQRPEVREAYADLLDALESTEPECLDDDRFTATRSTPLRGEEKKDLYLTCFSCPVFEECSAYARLSKPAAGYWAGKNYGTWERKP